MDLDYEPRPVSMKPARLGLLLLLGINLFNYVDRQIIASVEVDIRNTFGVSEFSMGVVASVFLVVYMATSPIFGYFADRGGRWKLVGISIILQSLASLGSGLAGTFAILILMRCLVGIGEACYGPVAPTLLSDLFSRDVRGKIMAWFYAAIPVGSALGYVIGGLMLKMTGDWRWGFYVITIPGMLLGIACFFLKDPPRGLSDGVTVVGKPTMAQYWALFRNKSFFYNCAGMTALTFAIGGIAFWMPTYLREERGIQPGPANMVFGAIAIVSGLSATLLGGWLGDKLRPRFPGSYFLVSAAGMLVGFPMFLLLLFTPFPYAWAVIFAACFCLFFNTGPSNTILANVTHPSIRASAFAANIFVIHALGDVLSPPLIGLIKQYSSFKWAFAMVSFTMFLGGIFWLLGAPHLEEDTRAATAQNGERTA
jgi:MFS transporter, Spinster family, sphingosine-1-phosphate transporter